MIKPLFDTEAALCAAFAAALPECWTLYPETAGFDYLLAHEDGFQIGVEAKLRLNAKVISQIAEGYWDCCRRGPDCRAVLVPHGAAGSFTRVCQLLGITVMTVEPEDRSVIWGDACTGGGWVVSPAPPEPDSRRAYSTGLAWHEWAPVQRCELPDYIPDVAAGVPAPLRLTDWKVKAIKIAILCERRGFVTRADFKALQLDHRRWLAPGVDWLAPIQRGVYGKGRHFPDFEEMHPTNYGEIEADFERWAPPRSGIEKDFADLAAEAAREAVG